jgi:hypothetical protein
MPEGEELGLIEDEGGLGDESGGEGAEEEITEGEPEGEGDEGGEGGEEIAEGEGEEERGRSSTRTLPTELRKALREFTAGNPDFAKKYPKLERQLTAALYKANQADGLGGLQQLKAAAEVIESHGGPEKIAEMAEEVEASRMMEEGFQQGDPQLIDSWSKEYPEGFKALVGPAIEKLEALDLAAHDRALSGPMYKTLDRCGVIGTVNDLEAAIAGERFEDIQKHFGALKNFLLELRAFSNKAKAPDPLKADRERLEQERSEIQTERQKTFYGGVRTDVNTQVMSYMNRILRQELAGRKLRVDTANRVRKQINDDLAAAVNTAPGYKEKYKSIMGSNDHGRAVNFIVMNARQKLPKVIKAVLRDFNLGAKPGAGGARRPAGDGARSRGASNVIAGRPKTSEVDFNRTDKAAYIAGLSGHGQAYLKNGKLAKW